LEGAAAKEGRIILIFTLTFNIKIKVKKQGALSLFLNYINIDKKRAE